MAVASNRSLPLASFGLRDGKNGWERIGRMTDGLHDVAVAHVEAAHHRGIHEGCHVGCGFHEGAEDRTGRTGRHGLREFSHDAHRRHVVGGQRNGERAEDARLRGDYRNRPAGLHSADLS